MRSGIIYVVCAIGVLIQSCKNLNSNTGSEESVAQVYDNVLYRKDLSGIGAHAAKKEDSIQAVKNYIESWIRHQVVLHQAGENISKEALDKIDKQLTDYKESLIIFEYEKELIRQKMDTTVTQKEIMDYFNRYKDNFTLKSSIIQLKYVVIPKDDWERMPLKKDTVRKWIRQKSSTYDYPLQIFVKKYSSAAAINDTTWYAIEDILKAFPTDIVPVDNWAYGHEYHEVSDNKYVYLIQFNDNRVKGTDAPLSYVYRQIRGIILNKRKVTFIEDRHKSIYEQAKNNGKIENYIFKK